MPGRVLVLAMGFVSARMRSRGDFLRAAPAVQRAPAQSGCVATDGERLLITRVNLCEIRAFSPGKARGGVAPTARVLASLATIFKDIAEIQQVSDVCVSHYIFSPLRVIHPQPND